MVDYFVRPDVLREVLAEVTDDDGLAWNKMDDQFQKKFSSARTRDLGPRSRALIKFMNRQEILGLSGEVDGDQV